MQLEVEAIKLLNHSRNDESPPLLLMSFDFSLYIIINISNLKHPLKQFLTRWILVFQSMIRMIHMHHLDFDISNLAQLGNNQWLVL